MPSVSRRTAYTVVAVVLGAMLVVVASMLRMVPALVAGCLVVTSGIAALLFWGRWRSAK